jgi:hypothetical protein
MQPDLAPRRTPWSQVVEGIDNPHLGVVPDKVPEVARVVRPVDDKDPISRLGHTGEVCKDAEVAPV